MQYLIICPYYFSLNNANRFFYKNQRKKVKYQLLTNSNYLQNTEAATGRCSTKLKV